VNTSSDDPIRSIPAVRQSSGGSNPVYTVQFTLKAGPLGTDASALVWSPGLWSLTVREFGNGVPGPVVGAGAIRATGLDDCTLTSMQTFRKDGTTFVPGGLVVSSSPATAGQIVQPFAVEIATAGLCTGPLQSGSTRVETSQASHRRGASTGRP